MIFGQTNCDFVRHMGLRAGWIDNHHPRPVEEAKPSFAQNDTTRLAICPYLELQSFVLCKELLVQTAKMGIMRR